MITPAGLGLGFEELAKFTQMVLAVSVVWFGRDGCLCLCLSETQSRVCMARVHASLLSLHVFVVRVRFKALALLFVAHVNWYTVGLYRGWMKLGVREVGHQS